LRHIKNIYKTGELFEKSTCAKFAQVQKEGNRILKRNILYYNLDMIISFGYRVNSKRGTQFRIWATNLLKQHLIQGYTIKQKRLKEQSDKIFELQKAVNYFSQNGTKRIADNALVALCLLIAESKPCDRNIII
jgi:hypothetical protein